MKKMRLLPVSINTKFINTIRYHEIVRGSTVY